MSRPRVLVLAEICNPEWPSLPVVGYKYAKALGKLVDMTLVTHKRNRENIEKAGDINGRIHYIDTEWLAGPMYRLALKLRGGSEVAWSTHQIMAYLPYLAFERQAWSHFKSNLRAKEIDLVHRITPMSPALPSWIAGRAQVPFVIGPLNGNLDWPKQFLQEKKREREGLRKLRNLYKQLPYSRRTYRKSSAILAAFQHTIEDLSLSNASRIISMPEIGYDSNIFNVGDRELPFHGPGPFRFLYAGRLVPYKLPEVAVRAFVDSDILKDSFLHIVGDGPELERLKVIVANSAAENRVIFEGRKSQTEVAEFMKKSDAFVFPSIRELGAGVVIEAMASGLPCIVTDYGAPGDLTAQGRGIRIPMAGLEELTASYRRAMEGCINGKNEILKMTKAAEYYAASLYNWDQKAAYTLGVYEAVLQGKPLRAFDGYV